MEEFYLWLIIFGIVINIILIFISIIRTPKNTAIITNTIHEEFRLGRDESNKNARELREEIGKNMKDTNDTIFSSLTDLSKMQQTQLDGMKDKFEKLEQSNHNSLDQVRTTLDSRVKFLQESNEKKLDEMRKTVDEKLQSTLEKRLGDSFQVVNRQLEAVQRGLGEMKNLATGVGDLKRVLTNVKARGTWAEVQLGAILEQILTPDQYEKNVRTKEETGESVEFAVKLPGPKNEADKCVWLPIDSKFPQEDYLRIQEAAEKGDSELVKKTTDDLSRTVMSSAQEIHNKYINPPNTTDFGIMFLATEGLYAEVLRQPSLVAKIMQDYRIAIAGPTTLAALLSSLRMGFQTLAIEQRAAEVWKILAAVKTEFGKFGEVLVKVKRQLNTATNTIETTETRTRMMQRKLRAVEQLPLDEASDILELPPVSEE